MEESAHRPHAQLHSPLRLRVAGLAVARGGRQVLADVSFSVSGGEALVVTGRNGVGKSTMLRAIAGLLPRAAGEVALEGGAPETDLAQQAHYLAHADGMKAALSVEENLEFWADYLGGATEDYVAVRGNDNVSDDFVLGTPDPPNREAWEYARSVRNSYLAVSPYVDLSHLIDFMLLWNYGNSESEFRACGPIDAGQKSGSTTQTRNTHTSNTAAIVPMPPSVMQTRARTSAMRTVGRVRRARRRPVNEPPFGAWSELMRLVCRNGPPRAGTALPCGACRLRRGEGSPNPPS